MSAIRDGHFRAGEYSVGFDVGDDGQVTFAVFDPKTNTFVGFYKPAETIDVPCEVVDTKKP